MESNTTKNFMMSFSKYFLMTFLMIAFSLMLSTTIHAVEPDATDLIRQAIQLDNRIRATNLTVIKRGDKYILSGSVPGLLNKDLIEEAVQSLAGNQYSAAGVLVEPPLVADESILATLTVSIPAHCQMSLRDFEVTVRNGTVTLKGIGYLLHHRWLADYIARSTTGVKVVVNKIQIIGEKKTDQWMRENILVLLQNYFQEDSISNLSVKVSDGHVTIGGTSNGYLDKKRIDEIVRNVNGVVSITNNILLKSNSLINRW